AYIDLNPVRAGLVKDPKDYRYCGYAEAVAGNPTARKGISLVWKDYTNDDCLQAYRELIFGKRAGDSSLSEISRQEALKVLEKGGQLPRATLLRCRVRYFTDGAILGSSEFVRGFTGLWQQEKQRKFPPKANPLKGSSWGDLSNIKAFRNRVFT
ncbi:MAG: transposase, partial [Verrucomicrobiota bacterium]